MAASTEHWVEGSGTCSGPDHTRQCPVCKSFITLALLAEGGDVVWFQCRRCGVRGSRILPKKYECSSEPF